MPDTAILRIQEHHKFVEGIAIERKKSVFVSPSPIKNRTYVNDMVAKIDERKRKGIKKPPAKVTKRPKKKIIYDDFGEPLREVWVDE